MKEYKEHLKDLLAKDVSSLTETDIIFLKARRGELNPKQEKRLEKVLARVVRLDKPVVADPLETLPEGEHPSFLDLRARARELGKNKVMGQTREELETYITKHEPK